MTLEEYRAAILAQGVPVEHRAFRCPVCGTVQSAADFLKAGLKDLDEVEKYLGFSCVGRFTGAGPFNKYKKGVNPGRGCDWTLGGLFGLQNLEVEHEGKRYPRFEVATPEEALEHMKRNTAEQAA